MSVHISNNCFTEELKFDLKNMVEEPKKNTLRQLTRKSTLSFQELEQQVAFQKSEE
jgi:hypothetical protein